MSNDSEQIIEELKLEIRETVKKYMERKGFLLDTLSFQLKMDVSFEVKDEIVNQIK